MFLINFVGYVKGYIIASIEGIFLERFINICMRRRIFLWNINKVNDFKILAKINIKDFKRIREVALKTKCKIKISKRFGLPFLLSRYKKRKFTLIGFFLFLIILWYLSTHVTGIIITGNEVLQRSELIHELKNFGISKGTDIKKINTLEIENKIMTKRDDIAWIGLNIQGSKLYLEIKERNEIIPKIDENVPCNIIATKDGVIESFEIRNGKQIAKIGSAVIQGDILVSGIIECENSTTRYVHSFGEVYAKTWYKKNDNFPMEYLEKINTGKITKKLSLGTPKLKINFYTNKKIPYTFYEKIEEKNNIKLLEKIFPNFYIFKNTFFEQEEVLKNRNEQETVEFGTKIIKKQLKEEIPEKAKVTCININHKNIENIINVEVEYECIENIAALSTFSIE
ncbi:MAG: sporulation protein YqfD [Clostridiales bacterium]|jgi:similar to stage IV sporulation protein|nr:sporulation protein YqfD [Clostridiales bacterium]